MNASDNQRPTGACGRGRRPRTRTVLGIAAARLPLAVACAVAAVAAAADATAAERRVPPTVAAAPEATYAFDIPAQPLASAVAAFAAATGWDVGAAAAVTAAKMSPGVRGRHTAEAGLSALLAGTGVDYRMSGAETVTLRLAGGDAATHSLRLAPVTVTAARDGGALDTLSRNVTVIGRDELRRQRETAKTTAEILGKLVPGMAPASGTLTNSSQTLRGRNVLVLIDGVPLSTNRNVSRDLFNISPSSIESIEVVHGGSAAYGGGAAGGIIHINTLKPEAGPLQLETTVGAASSLTQIDDDALSGRIEQKLSGKDGRIDYLLSVAGEQTQGFFDAEGDRIPPEPSQGGLSDTGTIDLLGKLGYEVGDQRLQLMTSYLRAEQDSDFVSDPSVNSLADGTAKAQALGGLQLDDQTSRENLIVNMDYSKRDLWGSELQTQAYYRNYDTRFFPFDGRPFSGWNALAQSFLESETVGGRLTIDTPFEDAAPVDGKLLWGADVNREKTAQPVTTFDGDAYDNSGGTVFTVTDDERTFVPEMTTLSYGVFGQLEVYPTDGLTLRGGVRHERVEVRFPGYTTLGQGNRIQGGEIDYAETTVNAGVVVTPVDSVDLYANYAQSFELPDIGLQLRHAPAGFDAGDSNLKPRIVDTYEVGMRGNWQRLRTGLSVFYSESDLGGVSISNFSLVQQRTPEKIYGVEANAAYDINDRLGVGGTFTWLEGLQESADGSETALNGHRIPPMKLTAFVEYSPYPWWDLRLQALYSGNRDSANDDGVSFGGRTVEDYTVVDLYSSFDVDPGTLKVGIENVLNNQYHTVFGQLLRNSQNDSHVAAQGATVRAAYTLNW